MKQLKKPVIYVAMALIAMSLIFVFVSAASKKPHLSKKKVLMYVGQTYKLKAKGFKGKVKWKSTNKKIATVNKKGKITAKKKGTVKIIAKYKKVKKACKVTIVSKKEYKKIIDNNKNKPEPTAAPIVTTVPEITTAPVTTKEGETTTTAEITTEGETTTATETTAPQITTTSITTTEGETTTVNETTTVSQITTTPATTTEETTTTIETTTEEETTTAPETTTEEETTDQYFDYYTDGIKFYENVLAYPNSSSSYAVYELIDADKAWERYHILRSQNIQLSDILTDLQRIGYVSDSSLSGDVPAGAMCKNDFYVFSYPEQILTYTDKDDRTSKYKILDFSKSWERFNILLSQAFNPDFNRDMIIQDLRAKDYIG